MLKIFETIKYDLRERLNSCFNKKTFNVKQRKYLCVYFGARVWPCVQWIPAAKTFARLFPFNSSEATLCGSNVMDTIDSLFGIVVPEIQHHCRPSIFCLFFSCLSSPFFWAKRSTPQLTLSLIFSSPSPGRDDVCLDG